MQRLQLSDAMKRRVLDAFSDGFASAMMFTYVVHFPDHLGFPIMLFGNTFLVNVPNHSLQPG